MTGRTIIVLVGLVVGAMPAAGAHPQSVAVSPDGRLVAWGYSGPQANRHSRPTELGHIDLWDLETRQPLRRIEHHGDIPKLDFSADGSLLAAVCLETPPHAANANLVRVFEVKTGDPVLRHYDGQAVTFAPQGQQLAIADARGAVVLEARTRRVIRRIPQLRQATELAFSPDGQRLYGLLKEDDELVLRVCEVATGRVLATQGPIEHAFQFSLSPDGELLASGHLGAIRLWRSEDLEPLHAFSFKNQSLWHPFFAHDGQVLAAGLVDEGRIELFDIESRELLDAHTFENGQLQTIRARFVASTFRQEGAPRRLAFLPGDQHIVAGYDQGILIGTQNGTVEANFPRDRLPRPWEPEPDLLTPILAQEGLKSQPDAIRAYLRQRSPESVDWAEVDAHIAALGADDFSRRDEATAWLRQRVGVTAGRLRQATHHPDPEVVARAKRLLADQELRPDRVLHLVLRQIAKQGWPLVPHLLPLADVLPDDAGLQHCLREAIRAGVAPADRSRLLQAMQAETPLRRRLAAAGLAALRDPQDQRILRQWAKHIDSEVRFESALGLLVLGDAKGLATLADLLEHDDVGIRRRAAWALNWATDLDLHFWPGAPAEERRRQTAAFKRRLADIHTVDPSLGQRFGPGGRTVLWMVDGGVREVDDQGYPTAWFNRQGRTITHAVRLPNGHRLVSEYRKDQVIEYDRWDEVAWMSGKLDGFISAAKRLPNGQTLVAQLHDRHLIRVESDQSSRLLGQWSQSNEPFDIEPLDDGRVLIAQPRAGQVVLFDPNTGLSRMWVNDVPDCIRVQSLPDGGVLVACRSQGLAREFDPQGRLRWKSPTVQKLRAAQRLPCGGTLLASDEGVVLIDSAGQTVRRYMNLFNNQADGAHWTSLAPY